MKNITIVILVVILVGGAIWFLSTRTPEEPMPPEEEITSFEECVAAGHAILESYPRQCQIPGGRTLIEEIEPEFIEVLSPNGGEQWAIGKTYKITWNCPEDADIGKMDIFIKDKRKAVGEDVWPIGGFIECSTEEYSWEIGDEITPGEDSFKIQLRYIAGAQDVIDESDDYFSIEKDENAEEQACIDSGGTVKTAMCCLTASDFPNSCLIGACGCSLENSHEVKTCDCGEGKCFDGETCISQ